MLSGVTQNDIVIVPSLTFIAAVNPVRYVGAEPIFMDCDDTLCLDPKKLREFCETECSYQDGKLIDRTTGKQVKAVVVVHVFGNIANMRELLDIATTYNLTVIEDATEAIGSYFLDGPYKGMHAGTLGHFGIYSFNGNKIITTGGGGMIVSSHIEKLEHAKHLTTQAKSDEVNFLHDEIGFNYRMTNLQAALGLAQMEQLETFIQTKITNHQYYLEQIATIERITMLPFREDVRSNRWFYSLYLEDGFPLSRDEVIAVFSKKKIQTRPIWGLINDQIPYKGFRAYKIEKAQQYQKRIINVPCSTNLTKTEINSVVACLKDMVREA
jgi:dTDP-4-amino-4,6-dideoxygalactose transaminase